MKSRKIKKKEMSLIYISFLLKGIKELRSLVNEDR